jgi:hypothetical protein
MQALYDIVLFCCCGAVGQLFIFYTIIQFGSLVNTLVTTSRKFLNILLSVSMKQCPGTSSASQAGMPRICPSSMAQVCSSVDMRRPTM